MQRIFSPTISPAEPHGLTRKFTLLWLDKHSCHTFQGYLFGKPVPIGEFEALLDKQL